MSRPLGFGIGPWTKWVWAGINGVFQLKFAPPRSSSSLMNPTLSACLDKARKLPGFATWIDDSSTNPTMSLGGQAADQETSAHPVHGPTENPRRHFAAQQQAQHQA